MRRTWRERRPFFSLSHRAGQRGRAQSACVFSTPILPVGSGGTRCVPGGGRLPAVGVSLTSVLVDGTGVVGIADFHKGLTAEKMEGARPSREEASTGPRSSRTESSSAPPRPRVGSPLLRPQCSRYLPGLIHLQTSRFVPTEVQMTGDDLKYYSWAGVGGSRAVPDTKLRVTLGQNFRWQLGVGRGLAWRQVSPCSPCHLPFTQLAFRVHPCVDWKKKAQPES